MDQFRTGLGSVRNWVGEEPFGIKLGFCSGRNVRPPEVKVGEFGMNWGSHQDLVGIDLG